MPWQLWVAAIRPSHWLSDKFLTKYCGLVWVWVGLGCCFGVKSKCRDFWMWSSFSKSRSRERYVGAAVIWLAPGYLGPDWPRPACQSNSDTWTEEPSPSSAASILSPGIAAKISDGDCERKAAADNISDKILETQYLEAGESWWHLHWPGLGLEERAADPPSGRYWWLVLLPAP